MPSALSHLGAFAQATQSALTPGIPGLAPSHVSSLSLNSSSELFLTTPSKRVSVSAFMHLRLLLFLLWYMLYVFVILLFIHLVVYLCLSIRPQATRGQGLSPFYSPLYPTLTPYLLNKHARCHAKCFICIISIFIYKVGIIFSHFVYEKTEAEKG